jgi:hypothetical protein
VVVVETRLTASLPATASSALHRRDESRLYLQHAAIAVPIEGGALCDLLPIGAHILEGEGVALDGLQGDAIDMLRGFEDAAQADDHKHGQDLWPDMRSLRLLGSCSAQSA